MVRHVLITGSDRSSPRNDTASIAELPDGRLMVAWHRYRPGSPGDFGRATIVSRTSTDGGLSWADERLLVDIDPGDVNVQAPALRLMPDGELLLVCVRAHAHNSTSMELFRSSDNGHSFVSDQSIWSHSNGQWLQGGNAHLLLLSDGRLLIPFHGGTGDQESQHNAIGVYASDDGGRSWQKAFPVVDLPMRGAMEASVTELDSGSLAMSIRTQLGSVFLSRSRDRGRTWSRPQTTGLRSPESSTCLRRLPGTNRLVLFWNDAEYDMTHHHFGIRTPLAAAISDDEGNTWKRIGTVDDGDAMFTNLGCDFLSDGTAMVTYLHVRDAGVKNGRYLGNQETGWENSTHVGLKCAILDRAWFFNG